MKSKIWKTKFTGNSDFVYIFTMDGVPTYDEVENIFYGYSSDLGGDMEVFGLDDYTDVKFYFRGEMYA